MRTFVWTFVAVFGGIWLFTKLSAAKKAKGTVDKGAAQAFEGPDIDPVSGAYLPDGNATGTVQMASSPNDLTSAPQKL